MGRSGSPPPAGLAPAARSHRMARVPASRALAFFLLAAGGFAGCALASKYTAVLFGAGLVLWLLAEPLARRWWRSHSCSEVYCRSSG